VKASALVLAVLAGCTAINHTTVMFAGNADSRSCAESCRASVPDVRLAGCLSACPGSTHGEGNCPAVGDGGICVATRRYRDPLAGTSGSVLAFAMVFAVLAVTAAGTAHCLKTATCGDGD
jgi:hypothetical protein